jgi:hypothetical protein
LIGAGYAHQPGSHVRAELAIRGTERFGPAEPQRDGRGVAGAFYCAKSPRRTACVAIVVEAASTVDAMLGLALRSLRRPLFVKAAAAPGSLPLLRFLLALVREQPVANGPLTLSEGGGLISRKSQYGFERVQKRCTFSVLCLWCCYRIPSLKLPPLWQRAVALPSAADSAPHSLVGALFCVVEASAWNICFD